MSAMRAKAVTAVAPVNDGAHDGHYSEAAMTSTFNGAAALASIVPRSTSWTLVITGRGLSPRGAAAYSRGLILRNPRANCPVKAVDLDGDRMRRIGPLRCSTNWRTRSRKNFRAGSVPFRKAYLQALINIIEIDDHVVRRKQGTS
jgi:hypothetical protein